MTEPTLFDAVVEGEAAKAEALQRVEDNADERWMIAAGNAIRLCAAAFTVFSSDEVWQALTDDEAPEPREPRAMGAAFQRAARAGLIRATGEYRKSVRPANHRRPVAIWTRVTPN